MKRNWKKVLSLVLALAMVLTMNTSVFATALDASAEPAVPATEEAAPAAEEAAAETPAAAEAEAGQSETVAPAAEETPAAAEAAEEPAAEAVETETPAAAAEEAPAVVNDSAEEAAAEGAESPENLVKSGTTVSGITVTYERHGSVVSDNAGNLTIAAGSIVGLKGTAEKPVTVTVGDGATVYVGYEVFDNPKDTDRDDVIFGAFVTLKNVQFAGNGKVIFSYNVARADAISINATNTVVSTGGEFVLSVNNTYKFYTDNDNDGYDSKSFTGLSGQVELFALTADSDLNTPDVPSPHDGAPAFAKEISANSYTISMNANISAFDGTKFKTASANVTTLNIGEGKDYNFGDIVFYRTAAPAYYYYMIPKKSETPDVSAVVGSTGDLMEGAWRHDGIDLDEVVVGYLKYTDITSDIYYYPVNGDGDIEFVLSKSETVPAATVSGWDVYTTGSHKVFKTLDTKEEIQPNTKYYLFARNKSDVNTVNPAKNDGFYSDGVLVGSFTTKETPDKNGITIPESKEITYLGSAGDTYARANGVLLKDFPVTFKDQDGNATKKLTVGTDKNDDDDMNADGYTATYAKEHVKLAVKVDGSTVGILKNYFVLSANGLSKNDVEKMSETEIADHSESTLGGMTQLNGNDAADLMYLSANKYYVKSFFEAYKDADYTSTGYTGGGDTDLPYLSASSNVMTLTVNPAPISVVPDLKNTTQSWTNNDGNTLNYNHWYSFSSDPNYIAVSGNKLDAALFAFDTGDGIGNPIVSQASDSNNDYYNMKQRKDEYDGVMPTGVLQGGALLWGDKNLEVDSTGLTTPEQVSANGTEARTIKVKVSENSLTWLEPAVSKNFIVSYPEYTITVNPKASGAETVSANIEGFFGQAYYGSTEDTLKTRIYYDYTIGSTKYWRVLRDGEDETDFGDFYEDEACTKKIVSGDDFLAEVEPGSYIYLSINKATVISNNKFDTRLISTNSIAKILIEPRPIDVYAHAYPYRGDAFDGKMDSKEIYGDVKEGITTDSTGRDYDYLYGIYGSDGKSNRKYNNIGFSEDDYYDDKKSAFQGADLLASTEVTAKNASLVDTTEETVKWSDVDDVYRDTPYKLYLDLTTGFSESGNDKLSAALAKRFYINTAVGYVTVQPKYTITYMLQYEDPRKDGGAATDKLVAYETVSFNKTQIYDGLPTEQKMTINPTGGGAKDEIAKWTENGDGVLNKEDGDYISGWKYMQAGGTTFENDMENDYGNNAYDSKKANLSAADYFVTAVVSAYAGSNVYVESIPPVFYEGLSHVADWYTGPVIDEYDLPKVKATEIPDLEVVVKKSDKVANLVYGKDYTISYKNNKDASVYFVDDSKTSLADKVKPVYSQKKKKPQVIIKGAGKYKGKFQATVYFDIYPSNIEGDNTTYITSLGAYYNDWRSTLNGIKSAYFAKTGKTAKVSYKVQNVQYPSKVTLNEWAPTVNPNYAIGPDTDKGKITTLKKNKDYSVIIERMDTAKDKNTENMGWMAVSEKEITPKEGSSYDYRITVKGKGNYTGTVESEEFTVCDQGSYADISKLKITTPKNLKWEDLMLNTDNSIKESIDLADLGIKVEGKAKSSATKTVTFSSEVYGHIYKVNKTGQRDNRGAEVYFELNNGVLSNIVYGQKYDYINGVWYTDYINDAGLYKLVLTSDSIRERTTDTKKKTTKTVKYAGTLEKTFTIKGIDLKAGDFQLGWKSAKWDGSSKAQSLAFSKSAKSKLAKNQFKKNTLNQAYVDKYLKGAAAAATAETYDPFWNDTDKCFEAYVRDYMLGVAGATETTYINYLNTLGGEVFGDVNYYDNGMDWKIKKKVDVYRYQLESGSKNKDVGTYTIYIPTDGIFGTDGLMLTYKRTGTATKILEVENAK